VTAFDPEAPLPDAPDPWAGSTVPAWRDAPPYAMTEMIAAEPALAERLARRLRDDPELTRLVDWLREAASAGEPITLLGCGTSEHAAEAIAGLWTAALDLPGGREVRYAQALEAVGRPQTDGVVVAVSHEGGTRFTNEALRMAAEAGARTALVSVSDRSPGAGIAGLTIVTGEQDQSWCHTVGYLSPIVVGAAVAARVADGSDLDATALRALLMIADDVPGTEALAGRLAACDEILVVGSGADHASARELALKLSEGARIPTQALHLETVLHGHLAAASERMGLVLILAAARTPVVVARARDLLRAGLELGMPAGAVIAADLGDDVPAELTSAGRLAVPTTGLIEQQAAGVLAAAVPIQLLAERLARARRVNPDTLAREDPRHQAAGSV
jgi:fructoselysine-6-P-deglycase FrlB-like protein